MITALQITEARRRWDDAKPGRKHLVAWARELRVHRGALHLALIGRYGERPAFRFRSDA